MIAYVSVSFIVYPLLQVTGLADILERATPGRWPRSASRSRGQDMPNEASWNAVWRSRPLSIAGSTDENWKRSLHS